MTGCQQVNDHYINFLQGYLGRSTTTVAEKVRRGRATMLYRGRNTSQLPLQTFDCPDSMLLTTGLPCQAAPGASHLSLLASWRLAAVPTLNLDLCCYSAPGRLPSAHVVQ